MLWEILSTLGTEIVLGKKVSILYGLTIGLPFLIVILTALFWEIAQIPIIYYIYSKACCKISFLNRFKISMKKRTKENKIFINLRRHGIWGIALLSLYPFPGGGVLSSVILANILHMDKKKVYFVIITFTILSLLFLGWLSLLILRDVVPPLLSMIR